VLVFVCRVQTNRGALEKAARSRRRNGNIPPSGYVTTIDT
jgi:hypothetical protein